MHALLVDLDTGLEAGRLHAGGNVDGIAPNVVVEFGRAYDA